MTEIKKPRFICTMQYYSAVRKDEIIQCAEKQVYFGEYHANEVNQMERAANILSHMWVIAKKLINIKCPRATETKNQTSIGADQRRGKGQQNFEMEAEILLEVEYIKHGTQSIIFL